MLFRLRHYIYELFEFQIIIVRSDSLVQINFQESCLSSNFKAAVSRSLRKSKIKHDKLTCRFELDIGREQQKALSRVIRHWTDEGRRQIIILKKPLWMFALYLVKCSVAIWIVRSLAL